MYGKTYLIFFYLCNTGQAPDLNNICVKMMIKTFGQALKIKVWVEQDVLPTYDLLYLWHLGLFY